MRPESFHADSIVTLPTKQRMATLAKIKNAKIKNALGTRVDMTVFRKLREVECLRSDSGGGK